MPELPEVETLRADLARLLPGQTIVRAIVHLPKFVEPRSTFAKRLVGQKITAVRRRGKLLLLVFGSTARLHIHLKMTGQVVLRHAGRILFGGHPINDLTEVPNRYTHLVITFRSGDVLYVNDLRQFGYARLYTEKASEKLLRHYGPEPLTKDFTLPYFKKIIARRGRSKVKALLLDQSVVAGVGNIYADESCFRARILPDRLAGSLSDHEIKTLWKAVRDVLCLSVRNRGTTTSTYVVEDKKAGKFWRYAKVYGRGGEPCKKCKTLLTKSVVAGRGTVFCKRCQR